MFFAPFAWTCTLLRRPPRRWHNTELSDFLQIALKRELKARVASQRRQPGGVQLTPPHSAVSEMTEGWKIARIVHRQGMHSGALPGLCCSFCA